MTPTWPSWRLRRLQQLLDDHLSYTKAAKRLGCSRSAVAGAVRRHIKAIPDDHQLVTGEARRRTNLWTEARLTEPWASWSARRRAERQQLVGADA